MKRRIDRMERPMQRPMERQCASRCGSTSSSGILFMRGGHRDMDNWTPGRNIANVEFSQRVTLLSSAKPRNHLMYPDSPLAVPIWVLRLTHSTTPGRRQRHCRKCLGCQSRGQRTSAVRTVNSDGSMLSPSWRKPWKPNPPFWVKCEPGDMLYTSGWKNGCMKCVREIERSFCLSP